MARSFSSLRGCMDAGPNCWKKVPHSLLKFPLCLVVGRGYLDKRDRTLLAGGTMNGSKTSQLGVPGGIQSLSGLG